MKYHAERAARTAADFRDAMPDDGPGPTAGTSDWPLTHGDDRGIAACERNYNRTRLHAGAAFHQDQFTTLKIALRCIKKDDDLKGKIHVPVEVLVQPIVVAGSIAQ